MDGGWGRMRMNAEFVDGVVNDLERIGACILNVDGETMWKQTNHDEGNWSRMRM